MYRFNHTRPIRDDVGEVLTRVPAPAVRVTVGSIATYGVDKDRPLVVSLIGGDVIEFRPARTRANRAVTAPAMDIYRWILLRQSNKALLERARKKKELKVAARARRRLEYAEKKLVRK